MQRIGLLSDSHGRAGTTREGVRKLVALEVEALIHLGDIGTVEVLDALAEEGTDGQPLPAYLVFGNTDWDSDSLASYADDLDLHVMHPVGRLSTSRGDLAFLHGHEPDRMQALLESDDPPAFLAHGHTHKVSDTRSGSTRVINPGALFRAATKTVGVLDVVTDRFDILTV